MQFPDTVRHAFSRNVRCSRFIQLSLSVSILHNSGFSAAQMFLWQEIHNNTRTTFIVLSFTAKPYARVHSGRLSESQLKLDLWCWWQNNSLPFVGGAFYVHRANKISRSEDPAGTGQADVGRSRRRRNIRAGMQTACVQGTAAWPLTSFTKLYSCVSCQFCRDIEISTGNRMADWVLSPLHPYWIFFFCFINYFRFSWE